MSSTQYQSGTSPRHRVHESSEAGSHESGLPRCVEIPAEADAPNRAQEPAERPAGRWIVPGTRGFEVFFPALASRLRDGMISPDEARRVLERQLLALVAPIARKHGRRDHQSIEDLAQDLLVRAAEMDAAARYHPALGSPIAYLHGIAEFVAMERYCRRVPPRPAPLDDHVEPHAKSRVESDPALLVEMKELLEELRGLADRLTPGETRALVHEFGPVLGRSCPKGRARAPRDPDALERAVAILRTLARQ